MRAKEILICRPGVVKHNNNNRNPENINPNRWTANYKIIDLSHSVEIRSSKLQNSVNTDRPSYYFEFRVDSICNEWSTQSKNDLLVWHKDGEKCRFICMWLLTSSNLPWGNKQESTIFYKYTTGKFFEGYMCTSNKLRVREWGGG